MKSTLSLLLLLAVSLATNATELTTSTGAPETTTGTYIESVENELTPTGEVVVDSASNKRLPEEVNDGELEGGDHHTSWSYANQQSWTSEYPLCNSSGMRQSPIDIELDRVIFKPEVKLEFVDYNQEVEFEFKNTHHSVSLTPIGSLATPSLRVNWIGEKEEVYELQEIHFHWGDGVNKGSEHEINDKASAAEMHMVHYRRGVDKTMIGQVENSVVVIGVLIESDAFEHNKLESLVRRTQKVNGTDLEYRDGNRENLMALLPDNHSSFYTYNGSLTTPPCYEVVTWVVMSEPVFMSQEKLVELSNLEAETADHRRQKIKSNRRNIQPLVDRSVYASFNTSDTSTYELSGNFKIKLIDGQNTRFSKFVDQYWARVNKLRVSVRNARQTLDSARIKLWLALTRNRKQLESSNGTLINVNVKTDLTN